MRRRELLLAVAELRVVLLELDPLALERVHERVHVRLRRGQPDRREAEARVHRDELAVLPRRERELVLEGDFERARPLLEPRRHPLQERAWALRRRLARERDEVDEHRAGPRGVRKHAKRLGVRDEPDLADRSHPLDRLELVEPVHRLHRDGEPDPALDPALDAADRARLGPDRPVVPAPEEAHEAEVRLVRLLDYLVGLRPAGVGVGVGTSRRCVYSLIA